MVNIENGGVESFIANVLKHIAPQEVSIDVAYNRKSVTSIFTPTIQAHANRFFSYGGRLRSAYCYLPKLAFYIYKYGPYDSVYVNAGIFNGAVLILGKMLRIKQVISHVHGNDICKTNWKIKSKKILLPFISWLADVRLATSQACGEIFYKNLPFTIIKNGIETDAFAFEQSTRQRLRKQLHLENKFVIGNVARLDTVKNHIFLLEIFKHILLQNPAAHLLLIGEGREKARIIAAAKRLNIWENLLILPPQPDIANYYQAMDCFVFPSLHEGLGLVAIEAQCAGLPCFISDGVPDEANLCNTTKIALNQGAAHWAELILKRTAPFVRKEACGVIKQAGFDIENTVGQLKKILCN